MSELKKEKGTLFFCLSVVGVQLVNKENDEGADEWDLISKMYVIEDVDSDSAILKAISAFSNEHPDSRIVSNPLYEVFETMSLEEVDLFVGEEGDEE